MAKKLSLFSGKGGYDKVVSELTELERKNTYRRNANECDICGKFPTNEAEPFLFLKDYNYMNICRHCMLDETYYQNLFKEEAKRDV